MGRGWLVKDFINALEPTFNIIQENKSHQKPFQNKKELEKNGV